MARDALQTRTWMLAGKVGRELHCAATNRGRGEEVGEDARVSTRTSTYTPDFIRRDNYFTRVLANGSETRTVAAAALTLRILRK